MTGLAVLAVDDEPPALADLAYLLSADPRVAQVRTATDGTSALRALDEGDVDAVFCDIRMPGLDGLALARVLSRFVAPPQVVFVTAYDDAAVPAFELRATDYLLKPVREERLAEAVRRVVDARGSRPPRSSEPDPDETIPVELGGTTRFVTRSAVTHVEAQGGYARLHTAAGSHLVRIPLATLKERWGDAGFVRVHRSTLVSLGHVEELRLAGGHYVVRVGGRDVDVARRHARELKDRLVGRATDAAAAR